MQAYPFAIEQKNKYIGIIVNDAELLQEVVKRHINSDFKIEDLKREWFPGGGSTLFQIITPNEKYFLKVMNLDIPIESKIEKEEKFHDIPSIRNEYNFIKDIESKTASENIPRIVFYEERSNYGFLAYEWLESFNDAMQRLSIDEIIYSYNQVKSFVRNLFNHNIVHTDIHENNIRFRGNIPVIIDYGETRRFPQDVIFEKSLDVAGKNKYGNLGDFAITQEGEIKGFTCLRRLKKVYEKILKEKLLKHASECYFDDMCPFNQDALQIPDKRIYQSVRIKGLEIKGQRPTSDNRLETVSSIARYLADKYKALDYIDVGSNLGSFCFKVGGIRGVINSIGVEPYDKYVTFANAIKFIENRGNVFFYNFGFDNSTINTIEKINQEPKRPVFVSMMSVYHHIPDKDSCIEALRKINPIALIIEFATQERFYPEREAWAKENEYIKKMLGYKYSQTIDFSEDYRRPIVIFTNNEKLYKKSCQIRKYKKSINIVKKIVRKISRSIAIPKDFIIRIRPKENKNDSINKAIEWGRNNALENKGIKITSNSNSSYPEVTGYFIPTLYQWGEKELARNMIKWLISIQNEDGSFSAPDGVPYTFDTGQVIRGFVSSFDDMPEVEVPLRRACDWVLTQIQADGRLDTPSTDQWGDIADDRIHLYVLPPIIDAGKKLNEQKYIESANRVLNYYKQKDDLVDFNTLSHFYAYIIEALCDLGEIDLAKKGMNEIKILQKKDGSVPAYRNVKWVCSTGLAQFALIWYKLGELECANRAMQYLENIQNKSGGFYGGYGRKANYFPKDEISWAVKYFLDANYWRVKTSFNIDVTKFPDNIDEQDGRIQALLEYFGDINNKKVLDIGCGKGRFLRVLAKYYPEAKIYGVDISEKMLEYCPEGIEKKVGTILDIKYPDQYFDCVYCVEALEHAIVVENALREIVRVLKPGGKMIVIDKNAEKYGKLHLAPWEKWFSRFEIENLLKKYGVATSSKYIAYEKHPEPDGLFIAWMGTKK